MITGRPNYKAKYRQKNANRADHSWFKYNSYTDEIINNMFKSQKNAIVKAAKHLRDKVKEKIGKNMLSLPGNAPGKNTGDLQRGVVYQYLKDSDIALVGFQAPAHHAHLMEFGTVDRIVKKTGRKVSRVLPRPFLSTTFEEEAETVKQILSEGFGSGESVRASKNTTGKKMRA